MARNRIIDTPISVRMMLNPSRAPSPRSMLLAPAQPYAPHWMALAPTHSPASPEEMANADVAAHSTKPPIMSPPNVPNTAARGGRRREPYSQNQVTAPAMTAPGSENATRATGESIVQRTNSAANDTKPPAAAPRAANQTARPARLRTSKTRRAICATAGEAGEGAGCGPGAGCGCGTTQGCGPG